MILLNFLILIEFFRPLSTSALPVGERTGLSSCIPYAGEGGGGLREQISHDIMPAITPENRGMDYTSQQRGRYEGAVPGSGTDPSGRSIAYLMANGLPLPVDGEAHQGSGGHNWGQAEPAWPATNPAGAVYPSYREGRILGPMDREPYNGIRRQEIGPSGGVYPPIDGASGQRPTGGYADDHDLRYKPSAPTSQTGYLDQASFVNLPPNQINHGKGSGMQAPPYSSGSNALPIQGPWGVFPGTNQVHDPNLPIVQTGSYHVAQPQLLPPPAQIQSMQFGETSGMQAQPERIPHEEESTTKEFFDRLKATFVQTVGERNIAWTRERLKDVKEKAIRMKESTKNWASQQQHRVDHDAVRFEFSEGPPSPTTVGRETPEQRARRLRRERVGAYQDGFTDAEIVDSINENPRPATSDPEPDQTKCLDTSILPSFDPFAPFTFLWEQAVKGCNEVNECFTGTLECCLGTGKFCMKACLDDSSSPKASGTTASWGDAGGGSGWPSSS